MTPFAGRFVSTHRSRFRGRKRSARAAGAERSPLGRSRGGKILVLLAVVLPSLLGLMALVLDGGLLMVESRRSQEVADAAATAAAFVLQNENGDWRAEAEHVVHQANGMSSVTVRAVSPPESGAYAGRSGFVEVRLEHPFVPRLPNVGASRPNLSVTTRSVAGSEPTTAPAAIVLLDPAPPKISIGSLPLALPSLTPLLGGFEVIGLGRLRVNGAILVNTTWGGVDEEGQTAGASSGPPYACSCTPLLPLTRVLATDLRVAGGVDDPDNYGHIQSGQGSPLQANRRPVPDPYADLPVPTLAADSANVSATMRGGALVVGLPFVTTTLEPGVYDWISVVTGQVKFNPGVYIIRGVNPATQIALQITTGNVQAEGVLFYITNSSGYTPASGMPDAADGEASPGGAAVMSLLPSVVINSALSSSRFSPLNDPGSPFHGLLFYQRRADRRPILIVQESLLGNASFSGNVYAKWGHVVLAGLGTYRCAFACGSLRVLDVLDCRIDPLRPLPAARDVYLVE